EPAESGKLENAVHFFVGNQRHDEDTGWSLVAEDARRDGHVLLRDLSTEDGVLFRNGLSYQTLSEFESLLQVLLSAVGDTCPQVDGNRIVFFIYHVKRTLDRIDFFQYEFDHILSERIQRVVKSEYFTDLCHAPYNPVAFLVAPLIFHEVLSHVNERHTQHVVVGYRLEFGVVLSFTDALRELGIILQCLYQVVDLGRHLPELV